MANQRFNVTGMTCSACSASVEKNVKKLEGVREVQVNLLSGTMKVDYDETLTGEKNIIDAVTAAGYGAQIFGVEKESKINDRDMAMDEQLKEMKKRLLVSFCFLILLMILSMQHMLGYPLPQIFLGHENALIMAFSQFLLTIPIVYVNRKYYQVGFRALGNKSPNMDSLIAIGSSAALLYGIFAIYQIGYGLGHGDMQTVHEYSMNLYFESAGMILALITLGKYLETRSKGKTGEAIKKLMDLTPKTATVLRDEAEIEIPVEQVRIGDVVVIRPGQRIPVDGVILSGNSVVDQSALTGESIPVEKKEGDKVSAATINRSGYFTFQAEKVGDDTTLAQIIRLVEEAGSSKAPISKLADKISGIFVPIVIGIAALAFIIWLLLGYSFEFAMSIGISVLVISCPCALGLATPVAIMVGTGKGAENGVLIKSAEALETAHLIDTVVLDKTGTVTEGRPVVTDIMPVDGLTERELIKIAAGLEAPSEHPLAEAVVQKGREMDVPVLPVRKFTAIPGRGIQAEIEGKRYLAGNPAWMQERNIDCSKLLPLGEDLAIEGKTPLYFAKDGRMIGLVAVADVVKPTSQQAVEAMQKMGIDVIMLTGDNNVTARAIQNRLGIDRVIAEVMPQDKEAEIRKLQEQGRKVAMVGDGINDAPALMRADVGIAIGAGTDIAIESADIVLIKNDLLDVPAAIELSKAVIKNIKINLFWAFFYNCIGIPLAAGVLYPLLGLKLSPMIGAAAMSLSSVCVVTNALRLRFFKSSIGPKPEHKKIEQGDLKMEKVLTIEGMMCAHCQGRVKNALEAVAGVTDVKVNLEAGTAMVQGEMVEDEALKSAVESAGYKVTAVK